MWSQWETLTVTGSHQEKYILARVKDQSGLYNKPPFPYLQLKEELHYSRINMLHNSIPEHTVRYSYLWKCPEKGKDQCFCPPTRCIAWLLIWVHIQMNYRWIQVCTMTTEDKMLLCSWMAFSFLLCQGDTRYNEASGHVKWYMFSNIRSFLIYRLHRSTRIVTYSSLGIVTKKLAR